MNDKNCVKCNHSNPSDMRFCGNCGADLTTADDLPATVFGENFQSGQTPPNFQPPQQSNFQPPQQNFQPQSQHPNFQQSPPNFQQPNYQNAPTSGGGQTKKILLGIGGVLIGLIMLASGGLKLYRSFGGSSSSTTTVSYTPTPQNLYNNTSNSSNSSSYNSTTSNNRNSSSSSSSSTSSLLSTGTYTGTGKNVTKNKRGDFLLRIDSVDAAGNVKGYFEVTNGLYGSCAVKGTIDSSKKLLLEGTFDTEDSLAISATVSGSTISAGYAVVATNLQSHSGNFLVTRR